MQKHFVRTINLYFLYGWGSTDPAYQCLNCRRIKESAQRKTVRHEMIQYQKRKKKAPRCLLTYIKVQ